MSGKLQSITNQELSRKEFLTLIGLGIVSVLGIGNLLRLITGKSVHQETPGSYGTSSYGGQNKR